MCVSSHGFYKIVVCITNSNVNLAFLREMADTVLARFVVDVKDNSFEEVTAAYSVTKYDENTFNLQNIKGTHYMILEDDDHYNNIDVLTDLASIIK